jgi:glycosyltransferase involved in cell wall biosynthesis
LSFLIVTHVKHTTHNGNIYAYGPYVREMNIWFKHVDAVIVVAPRDSSAKPNTIDLAYKHPHIRFIPVPSFHFTSVFESIKSLAIIPYILIVLYLQMWKASHIHLRCPGNMGLLGCLVQILFPWKKKTAKYAGNWDWSSSQPYSYRIQQRILRNTWLTHNMQALVYGVWSDKTNNIKPFFTASYSQSNAKAIPIKTMRDDVIHFIFVGTLTPNKQPLKMLQVFANLLKHQPTQLMRLDVYGEGSERIAMEQYITTNKLQDCVCIHGNVDANRLEEAYSSSHFLLFFSNSEGWPKAVAEAMWWGCVPITTAVSCVPQMLGNGQRGYLVQPYEDTINHIVDALQLDPNAYIAKSEASMQWSRQYTLERFEEEINKLV